MDGRRDDARIAEATVNGMIDQPPSRLSTGFFAVHEQGLPELPVLQDIGQLFEADQVVRHPAHRVDRLSRDAAQPHRAELGLCEILQAMLAGSRGELVEIHRFVEILHVIVEQILARLVEERIDFLAHEGAVRTVRGQVRRQEVEGLRERRGCARRQAPRCG
jgi:hypothetical protein